MSNLSRIQIGVMITTTLLVTLAAGAFESTQTTPPARWLPLAECLFLGVAIYALGAPFALEAIHRRGALKTMPPFTPEQLILLLAVMVPVGVSIFAFLLVALGGATAGLVYISTPIMISSILFWCWRYRRVLG